MEAPVLKALALSVGIGGVAVGVAFFLYRDILRLKLFPRLSNRDAFLLLNTICFLSFVLALVGMLAWAWPPAAISAGRDINAKDITVYKK
jgi:hypothetical protein